jgi:putative transposase
VNANIGHRSAERSSGVDGEDVTASLGWNLPASRRAWDAATSEIAPCWSECGTEAFNTGLDGVAHLVEELGGLPRPVERAGREVGFPRWERPPSHHTQRAVHHRGDPR